VRIVEMGTLGGGSLPPALRAASPNPTALWLRQARARAKPEAGGWRAGRSRGPASANAMMGTFVRGPVAASPHWGRWTRAARPVRGTAYPVIPRRRR
jgi:hypothetical protein